MAKNYTALLKYTDVYKAPGRLQIKQISGKTFEDLQRDNPLLFQELK